MIKDDFANLAEKIQLVTPNLISKRNQRIPQFEDRRIDCLSAVAFECFGDNPQHRFSNRHRFWIIVTSA